MKTPQELSKTDRQQYETAMKIISEDYYDRHSPHYLDNERYRWAVETINIKFGIESPPKTT